MQSQPVPIVKQGRPGWMWGIMGLLLGVIVIGGLALGGVLPFNSESTDLTPPPVDPALSSLEGSTLAGYCPDSGGVILYWNAGYDCANYTDDPGYRQRVGDGRQDLNTGHFDSQASSIQIPVGWSVSLYAEPGQQGASVCFNTSISNFMDHGNYPGKGLPINDNVSSMEVFRDGTCGEDLAAGAEPAPWPEVDWLVAQPDVPGPGPVAPECQFISACPCMPEELHGVFEGFENEKAFNEKYIKDVRYEEKNNWPVDADLFIVEFKDFGDLYKQVTDLGIKLQLQVLSGNDDIQELECEDSKDDPNGLVCVKPDWMGEGIAPVKIQMVFELDETKIEGGLYDICLETSEVDPDPGGEGGGPDPNLDACGGKCLKDESCVPNPRTGKYICQGPDDQPVPEPPTCNSLDPKSCP